MFEFFQDFQINVYFRCLIKCEPIYITSISSKRYTGLPTKDETSDTIVRNLHCVFPHF